MASALLLFCCAHAVLSFNIVYGTENDIPLPIIDLDEWWGPENATKEQDCSIRKFQIKFDESMIKDLIYRLRSHRPFTPPLEGVAFQYGFNSNMLPYWITYLAEKYPFKQREKFLNQFPHYVTTIQGLRIHFMRVKTQGPDGRCFVKNCFHSVNNKEVIPLLLLHGWPGSVREFYETIPYLLSQAEAQGFAFDIIVPSLPGFGYSDGAARPGLGVDKMAIVFRNLMQRLGYSAYYVQGGDFGALIGSIIATFFSHEVLGYHTNMPFVITPEVAFHFVQGSYYPEQTAKPELLSRIYPLTKLVSSLIDGTGYMHIQATRPDALGVGFSDSPSALIAYLLERISAGLRKKFITYPDGGLTEILTHEQLFDNIMIYWSRNCITTSMRIYAETLNKRYYGLRIHEIKTPVPTWVLQAPDEIIYFPLWMLKAKYLNILNETLPSEGGHFYAWEQPKHFAEDVVKAIVAFRKWHAMNSFLYGICSRYIAY